MNSIQVVYRTTFMCFLQTGTCSCFHFSSSSSLTFLSHSISFGTFFSFGHWWHPNQIFIVLLWVCPTWRPMISYCLDHKLGPNICETRLMEEQLWEGGECYKRTIYSLEQGCEWVYKENLTFFVGYWQLIVAYRPQIVFSITSQCPTSAYLLWHPLPMAEKPRVLGLASTLAPGFFTQPIFIYFSAPAKLFFSLPLRIFQLSAS